MIGHQLIRTQRMKNIFGEPIELLAKPNTYKASIFGGTIFGLGWAMTGACPGPLYVLLGQGIGVIGVVILSALFGTFCYGLLKSKLPH